MTPSGLGAGEVVAAGEVVEEGVQELIAAAAPLGVCGSC